ncbi:Calx-beta domain-containing protein [Crateriforma conspicua]|uniref:Calx-beta domain protein n=1 Tax=Crateriforma conspicua TaxID=2527996 RepID=A0A5C5XSN3_9PLAN|nr:Calx-beta domain-containing protein [Crateriforma conspicua]TWT65541.1 Calx-beta domain protein [Crateriforma conspicua]
MIHRSMFRNASRRQSAATPNQDRIHSQASRWEAKREALRQRWAEKRAARIERYRDAFRGSWIYRVGLGLLAIWNAVASQVPFEITRRKAPLAPYMMMGFPFMIRRKDGAAKKKKSKSAAKPRFANSQAGQLHAEALESRQLLAANVLGIDLNPGSDSGIAGDQKTEVSAPSFDVSFNNFNPSNSIVLLDSTGAITGTAGSIIGSSGVLPVGPGTTTIMMSVPFPADGSFDVEADSALVSGTNATVAIEFDDSDPSLVSATFDTATINEDTATTGAMQVTLDLTFSEAMDTTAPAPTITLIGTDANSALAPNSGSWSVDGLTYSAVYDVTDGDDFDSDVTVDVSGVSDEAGNAVDLVTATGVSTGTVIDTVAPLAPTVDSFSDDNGASGSDGLTSDNTITIEGTAEPLADVEVFVNDGGGAVSLGTVAANGAGDYAITSGVLADGTYEVTAVATDAAGNDSPVATAPGFFTIETVLPSIVGLTLSDTFIDDDEVMGPPGTVDLVITFDEAMDVGVPVTVSSNVDGTTFPASLPAGVWSAGNTVYTVTIPLDDADEEVADVTFDISGAQDVAGNTMAPVVGQSTDTPSAVDTLTEEVDFTINDSSPQEDILPSTTLVNAEVTFTVDNDADSPTVITYQVGMAGDTATYGDDYQVEGEPAANGTDGGVPTFTSTVTIPQGDTEIKLDINMLGDLIWEGDETFTVKIVSVSSGAMDVSAPQTVTIEDNEVGAEVTLMAIDNEAAETFQFEIADDAISGNPIFNSDIVANTGDGSQDPFGPAPNEVYATDSQVAGGLPDGGMIPGNAFGPAAMLTYNNADNGPNARVTPAGTTPDVFNIPVVPGDYSEIHLYGAAVDGTAQVSVRFFYNDAGPASAQQTNVFTQWNMPIADTADLYTMIDGVPTRDAGNTATGGGSVAVFGSTFVNPDPSRELAYVEVSVNTSDADNAGDGGDFAFLGASGVQAAGTMGMFAVKLDFAINDPLTVVLDTTVGDAINGTDYVLSIESDPVGNPGVFDMDLPAGPSVTVEVPAGETERLIKLTAVEDMIIEGGIVDNFGTEDATLEIDSRSVTAGPLPDIGTPDQATVTILDDDQGLVSIEKISDADENGPPASLDPVSGEFKVTLNKTDTTSTGMTTSSTDTIVAVDIAGEAVVGTDYQTSITSTEASSLGSAQRVDGFWSLQEDDDISFATSRAHNTVRAETTVAAKHYYEIVLYQPGRITADIDLTSAASGNLNTHLRILRPNGSVVGANNNTSAGTGAGGSSSSRDAYVMTSSQPAGRYIIEVSRTTLGSSNSGANNASNTTNLIVGDAYTLNISIENHLEGVLIPAGQEMTTFNIDPIDDSIVEGGTSVSYGSEDVEFTLSGMTTQADPNIDVDGGNDTATLDIEDDDTATLTISTDNGFENPLPTPPNTPEDGAFTFTLSEESSTDTTVKFQITNFQTADNSIDATYGLDYTLSVSSNGSYTFNSTTGMGTITIPQGETAVDLNVVVVNDDIIEDDEDINLVLVPGHADSEFDPDITVSTGPETVTIFDEDISDVAINGTAFAVEGGQNGVFTVSLDSPKLSDTDTIVEFQVIPAMTSPAADIPPAAEFDIPVAGDVVSYNPTTGLGTVRISAFQPSGQIVVVADDDSLLEPTEHIKVELTGNVTGDSNIVDLSPGQEAAEIQLFDNDQAFVKVENNGDGDENAAGAPTDGQFKFTLVNAAGVPVTAAFDIEVSYSLVNPATTATAGPMADGFNIDYQTLDGSVTIDAGDTMAFEDVVVFEDIVNESTEYVVIGLTGTDSSQVTPVTMTSMNTATVAITDDDIVEVTIVATDNMAREGNDDGQYKLQLSTYSDAPIVVDLAQITGNGPYGDASTSDYTLSSSTVTFAPFELMSGPVDLNVTNDAELEEFIEQVELGVDSIVSSNPGVSSGGSATVIIKPDPTVSVRASDMMGTEEADDAQFIVELPLVQNSGGPIAGNYNKADGDLTVEYLVRGTAVGGDDYTALSGSVVVPAADGFAYIDVSIINDLIIEETESVTVTLTSVTAVDPNDGDIAVRRDLYAVESSSSDLSTINVDVGDAVADGTVGLVAPITLNDGSTVDAGLGIDVDPTDQQVYAVVAVNGESDPVLVTLDVATGWAERVGSLNRDIVSITFDSTGKLYGIQDNGKVYTINKSTAATSAATGTTSSLGSYGVAVNGSDIVHRVGGDLPPGSGLFDAFAGGAITVLGPDSLDEATGMEGIEEGNFAGNGFLVADEATGLARVEFNTGTAANDVNVNQFAAYSGLGSDLIEDIAFVNSTAAVLIKDDDAGILKVAAKDKGHDRLNDADTVDTGFTITLSTAETNQVTTSSTDTTFKFTVDDTATPFLGDQLENSSSASGQDIDTFNTLTGGADHWKFNGSGVPHTKVLGTGDATDDLYTFTVLNDGDSIELSVSGGGSTMTLLDSSSTVLSSGPFITGSLDAGVYTVSVSANNGQNYTLDVAVENHLIADYELTADNAVGLTSLGGGMWEATIPADESSIMINVDVFNDTQVEGDETVTLGLNDVTGGDADIYLGGSAWTLPFDGQELVLISTATGETIQSVPIDPGVGQLILSGNALAQDPLTGDFYASLSEDAIGGDALYIIDSNTGQATLVGVLGDLIDAIDFDAGFGSLYGVGDDLASGNNALFFINPLDASNFVATTISPSTLSTGLAYNDDDGLLYHLWGSDNPTGFTFLETIDPFSLAQVNIPLVGSSSPILPIGAAPEGFAYEGNGVFKFIDTFDNLYSLTLVNTGSGVQGVVEFIAVTERFESSEGMVIVAPMMTEATAVICDHDEAEVYVSSDNTLAEASVDPAHEGNPTTKHKDIVVSLRDANGVPVTSQTPTLVDYTYKASSTATNGSDFATLDGDVLIPAGQSSQTLENTLDDMLDFDPAVNSLPSVFVFNDAFLEGDETAEIGLDDVAAGDDDISIVASNADMEDMGVVLIKDNETASVSFTASDDLAKERDGSDDEPLNPGAFTFNLDKTSSTDTTVAFMVDASMSDAEATDYSFSANPANNLTDLGGGIWAITIPANQFSATVMLDVVEDELIELDEDVTIKVTNVLSASNATIGFDPSERETVTIYDDDIGKVIIENVGNAVESTQPGTSPGIDGRFKISIVDPITGDFVESETPTTVRVLLDESIPDAATFSVTTGTNDGDYTIDNFVTPTSGPRYIDLTFDPGDTMLFLDVELIEETPPLDMGDEFVKLTLDPTYGVATDTRPDDGVVGDNQILLDAMPGGGVIVGNDPDFVFAVDVSGSTSGGILAAEKAALIALNNQLITDGFGANARVSVVPFTSSASAIDMEPGTPGFQYFTSPTTDSDMNGTNDVEQVINALSAGGGTSFESALQEVVDIFQNHLPGTTSANGNVVFVSDGFGGSGFTDEVATLQGLADNIRAFGVGSGSSLSSLQLIDSGAIQVTNPNDLVNAITVGSGGGMTGGGGELVYTFDPASGCPDIIVDGMGMNMATVTIIDEEFKININANDQNASEPGTLPLVPGDNGQFTISISNPWQFGDTIVNYTVTGTATTASDASGALNPADYADLDGYDPSNPDFVSVSIDGQAVIPAGASSVLLDVAVIDDLLIELDPETVVVTLTGLDDESTTGSGNVENVSSVGVRMLGNVLSDTVNIFDNDGAVANASVSDADANEPNSPADNGQFMVTLENGGSPITSISNTTVEFMIGGDAADGALGAGDYDPAGADFTLALDPTTSGAGYALTYNPATNKGLVTIPAGESTVKINVVTLNDYVLEDDETVTLTPINITSGEPGISASNVTSSAVTIEDTDVGMVEFVALDPTGNEPGGLNPDAAFRVYLVDANNPSQRLASDTATDVTYDVLGTSTATAAADYVTLSEMVTIPAFVPTSGQPVPDFTLGSGDGEAIIGVHVLDDPELEPTETVNAVLGTAVGDPDISPSTTVTSGTVSIIDNDSALVSIKSDTAGADDDAAETDPQGQNDGKFEVFLSAPSATPTVVTYTVNTGIFDAFYFDDYLLTGGPATAPIQPGSFTGSITIGAGDISGIIDLSVLDDNVLESDEDVTVEVTSTSNPNITPDVTMDTATITIKDNDLPTFTVMDAMADEDDGTITFTIKLDQPIDQDVDVFLTFPGSGSDTATGASAPLDNTVSDQDYVNTNTGLVNFPANGSGSDLVRTISVPINDDNWVERDETFTAQLVVDGGSLANPTAGLPIFIDNGVGTIKDNDTATFTIFAKGSNPSDDADPTVTEGTDSPNPYNNGSPTTPVEFEVELSNPIDTDVDVEVSFGGGTATGANFSSNGSGTSISSGSASFGTDYDNGSKTITFTSGQFGAGDRKEIDVAVIQDLIVEGGTTTVLPAFGSETFVASLTPDAGDLGSRSSDATDDSTATITDDDEAVISVDASDEEASEDGDTPDFEDASFTITQSNPSQSGSVVKFTLTGDAVLNDDYQISAPLANNLTPLGGGMYSVEIPGSSNSSNTSVLITVEALNNTVLNENSVVVNLLEDDEFVTMTLDTTLISADPQVTVGTDVEDTVRINDGDAATVKVSSDTADGGNPVATESGTNAKFVFFLNDDNGPAASDSDTLIEFSVPTSGPGIASPTMDYNFTGADLVSFNPALGTGVVRIDANTSTGELTLVAVNDTAVESTETLTLTITDVISNADIDVDPAMPSADAEIQDDGDGIFVTLKATDPDASEPDDAGEFTVQLVDGNMMPITNTTGAAIEILLDTILVDPDPNDATPIATPSLDYDALPTSVTINPGEGSSVITVDVNNDDNNPTPEPDELVIYRINPATTDATIVAGMDQDVVTIADDDAPLSVTSIEVNNPIWSQGFRDEANDPTGATTGTTGYVLPDDGGQNAPLPWVNITEMTVEFSDNIDPLSVPGQVSFNSVLTVPTFTTSVSGNRLKIQFTEPLDRDAFQLVLGDGIKSTGDVLLDGEYATGSGLDNSGNGTPGGDLVFSFRVNPGDVNQSGTVAVDDVLAETARLFRDTSDSDYFAFADINGSGTIAIDDLLETTPRLFDAVPAAFPGSLSSGSSVSPLLASSSSASSVDQAMADMDEDDTASDDLMEGLF